MKYNPEYTCLLVGAKWLLDNGVAAHRRQRQVRRSSMPACCCGNDPYRYPDNLPVVGGQGRPGGKPGCGSLPDVEQELAGASSSSPTPAGAPAWTSGPTPGIGSPMYADYLPVTKGTPEPPQLFGLPGAGTRPDSLPGRPAVRGTAVRARRRTAVAGRAARTRPQPEPGS